MRTRVVYLLLACTLSSSCAQPEAAPPAAAPIAAAVSLPAAAAPDPGPNHSWTLGDAASESLGPGITYLRNALRKSDADNPASATLHLVRFESSRYTLKVVDQGDAKPGKYRNLAEAMVKSSCLAGCNGGFFHPDFRPSGLVIADGNRINRFENAKLLSGVLLVDSRGPHILRRAEFKDGSGITQLLQSGPFLVDRGSSVAGLSTSPARTRTFIATDGSGTWIIGLCNRVSLAALGEILADPGLLSGFKASRALNLDGGSSSSLYFKREDGRAPFHQRSFASVRNFLGIAPR